MIPAFINLIVFLLVIGILYWVADYVITNVIPEPPARIAHVVLVVLVALAVVIVLLNMLGVQTGIDMPKFDHAMTFNREIYFDKVRASLFQGTMDQGQVDGQNAILGVWEKYRADYDLRWLAYMLATTLHETASTMMPIEEYGKGAGMEYGSPDPETGQTYFGRGFIQLTWRDNYRRGDQELQEKFNVAAGMEAKAGNALIPVNAAAVMFLGMEEGWFRSDSTGRQTLARYFDEDTNDAWTAREIINGDKKTVPSWSNGVNIGNLIKGYHNKFLDALEASRTEATAPLPPEPDVAFEMVDIAITATEGAVVSVTLNGEVILAAKGTG